MTNPINDKSDILLIEDDAFFAELLLRAFSDHGFSAKRTLDLREARVVLKTHSFIVVCFDSIVFGEEGLKLLSELVTNPYLEKSPIVLLANEKIQEAAQANDKIENFALVYLVRGYF